MSKKVVLITGTNSGFGWLTAKSVAALGHQVYATMRDVRGRNAAKADELSAIGNVTVLDVSLTDEAGIKAAVDTILAKEAKLDVLVNNAGIAISGVAESFTMDEIQETFDVNVFAPWKFMKAVLPAMRQQSEGLIINVSSGFGRFSAPFSAVYGASKFGLEGLSEGMHYELRPLGVDVAILQPGAFPTEMNQKYRPASDASVNDGYEKIAEVPLKMFAAIGQLFETLKPDPQLVADAVVGLISLPKGERPLRTVVDPSTGAFVSAANEAVKVQYAKGLAVLGMGDLLA
jgi:NAD(P)-dependent dehydrogenase (short-subunit alcohol dehydrogenase family)